MKFCIQLVDFSEKFLELSFLWLSDSEINRLTNTGLITRESQKKWFASLSNRIDYKVWGVCYDEIPIGVCGLKHIQQNCAEYFGYIGDKSKWGGTGTVMMQCVEQKALELGIDRLILRVLSINNRAIALYKKMGYVEVSFDGEFYTYQKNIH